jgi:glycosyltransferase involved in cell wall biosynthesis
LVSVGIPTYNRPDGLRKTLECITRQSYQGLEIIVSDNGSMGSQTEDVVKEFMSVDNRVSYYRQFQNMGPSFNFQFILDKATGDYFMWASDDDYWDLSYIRSCLEAFKKSRDIILVGTICKSINSETDDSCLIDEGFSTIGLSPRERFVKYKSVIHSGKHVGAIFYGLYKRDALKKVMPPRNVIASDHLMLAELCFLGEFETIQKMLFVKRQGGVSASIQQIAKTLNIENKFLIRCPYLVREALLQRLIFSTKKLKVAEKVRLSLWSVANYLKITFHQVYPAVLPFLNRVLPRWIKCLAKRVLSFRQKSAQQSCDEKDRV